MAKLVVLTEGFTGTVHELSRERTTVGRLEDNNFQIAEPSVSSHHCEIILKGEEMLVKDLNSTNGTFINDQPVTEAPLKPGQILRLGKVELRLEDGRQPPAGAPAAAVRKPAQQTMPIGGVKLGELDKTGKPVVGPGFARKSDSANKLFLYGGLVLGLIIIALIVYSIMNVQN